MAQVLAMNAEPQDDPVHQDDPIHEDTGLAATRRRRWRFFQVAFLAVYVGIIGDIFTTWLGYVKSGNAYEQNPLGGGLIGHLGWPGLAALLTGLCVVCYFSVRVVYARMSLRWCILINTLMVLIALVRWLAVVTAVIYLFQPGTH